MPINWPNVLTWLRILLIPLVIGVFYVPDDWLTLQGRNTTAACLFLAAGITDWLDGYLARRLNQTSAFGAFLDPVADKLVVAAALIMLVSLGRVHAVIAMVIIGREITISALREWMAKLGQSAGVTVNFLGKIKTAFQLVAIPLLLYDGPVAGWQSQPLGRVLIYVAAGLTLVSMAYYLRQSAVDRRQSSG
jgi:cardiolipin synthase